MEERRSFIKNKRPIECYWPHNIEKLNALFLLHNDGYYLNKEELQNFADKINNALKYYDKVGIDDFNMQVKEQHEKELKELIKSMNVVKEPRKKKQGYIYFINDNTALVKIGLTQNLKSRFKSMQTGNPTLKIIHHIKSNDIELTEELFHKKFEKKRINGEWFDLNADDIQYIKNGKYSKKIKDSIRGE